MTNITECKYAVFLVRYAAKAAKQDGALAACYANLDAINEMFKK